MLSLGYNVDGSKIRCVLILVLIWRVLRYLGILFNINVLCSLFRFQTRINDLGGTRLMMFRCVQGKIGAGSEDNGGGGALGAASVHGGAKSCTVDCSGGAKSC